MSSALRFIPDAELERRAMRLLQEYQRRRGRPLAAPIVAEKVVQIVYELDIVWDRIAEPAGQTYLAGLAPSAKTIVLNEGRRRVFEDTPGLHNTVLGHEGAHWELHVDKRAASQLQMDSMPPALEHPYRHDSGAWDPRELQAHRFMGYLLLPHDLLSDAIRDVDLLRWPNLYHLRERFDVTISALTIRLERLGLVYAGPDRRLYRSRGECAGQAQLDL